MLFLKATLGLRRGLPLVSCVVRSVRRRKRTDCGATGTMARGKVSSPRVLCLNLKQSDKAVRALCNLFEGLRRVSWEETSDPGGTRGLGEEDAICEASLDNIRLPITVSLSLTRSLAVHCSCMPWAYPLFLRGGEASSADGKALLSHDGRFRK